MHKLTLIAVHFPRADLVAGKYDGDKKTSGPNNNPIS